MSSGQWMAEPASAYSAVKLALTGSASGLTYAVAAVQSNPEIAAATTPDLKTSLYMLAFGVLLAAGKTYLPSEKKVDTQFEDLKHGQKTLAERLIEFATESKEESRERREHYNMLYRWMGTTDARFDAMDSKFDLLGNRIDQMESRNGDKNEK